MGWWQRIRKLSEGLGLREEKKKEAAIGDRSSFIALLLASLSLLLDLVPTIETYKYVLTNKADIDQVT